MSLFVRASGSASLSSPQPADWARDLAAQTDVFVLDIDDTLYHAATGVHDAIKRRIVADANASAELAPLLHQWASLGKLEADAKVKEADLGWAFPPIVDFYRQRGESALNRYLAHVYDVAHEAVPFQADLVAAVDCLRASGARVVLYTNGPWRSGNGEELHVARLLRRIGFAADAFSENDVVDLLKVDRNPSLMLCYPQITKIADIFAKGTSGGFARMAQTLGLIKGQSVAFIDDSLANLAAAGEGVLRVHIATHEGAARDAGYDARRDYAVWSQDKDGLGHYWSPAGLVLQEIALQRVGLSARLCLRARNKAAGLAPQG